MSGKIKKLSETFNRNADHFYSIASNKSFLTFAFVLGVVAVPFSTTIAATCLAAPAVYAGVGLLAKSIGAGLGRVAGGPSV